MKQKITVFFIPIFIFFALTGCSNQSIHFEPNFPDMEVSNPMNKVTPYLFILGAVLVTGIAYKIITKPRPKRLTAKGAEVVLLMHQEAPTRALFIGDVQTRNEADAIAVKRVLRNIAAKMVGNLLIIDNINTESDTYGGEHIFTDTTYSGSGRVYKTNPGES